MLRFKHMGFTFRSYPKEASETEPQGNLRIHSYMMGKSGIWCINFSEPHTIPLKGYEYRLDENKIYSVINDLQSDPYSRGAKGLIKPFQGSFQELKELAHKAIVTMSEKGIDFECALHFLKTGELVETPKSETEKAIEALGIFEVFKPK